jgi:hypothetical protein
VAADEPARDQAGGDARPAAELEDPVVGLDVEKIDGPRHAGGHGGAHGSIPDRGAAPDPTPGSVTSGRAAGGRAPDVGVEPARSRQPGRSRGL